MAANGIDCMYSSNPCQLFDKKPSEYALLRPLESSVCINSTIDIPPISSEYSMEARGPKLQNNFQQCQDDSRNALRTAIFEKVLSSFPLLKKQLHHSESLFREPKRYVSTDDVISEESMNDQISTKCPAETLPNLACDVLEEELETDSANSDDSSQDLDFNSPQLTQMIDAVMENSPGVQDIIKDISLGKHSSVSDVTKSCGSNRKTFTCDLCQKLLITEQSFVAHMRRHKGVRPFPCRFCDKSFNQRSTLKTHERVHTGEKPYQCSFCSKAFADFSTYTKHTRIHTGEKPYSCDVCGKGFAQSGNMIRHRQTHKTQQVTARLMDLSPMF